MTNLTKESTQIAPDELRAGLPTPLNQPSRTEDGSQIPGDVFELLKIDHDQIATLFTEITGSSDPEAIKSSFMQLYKVVMMHTQAEEKAFYPVLLQLPDATQWVTHNLEGHQDAKNLLEDIRRLNPSSEEGKQTVLELQSLLDNHVREEEDYLFNAARTDMNEEQLKDLAQQVQQARLHFAQELALSL